MAQRVRTFSIPAGAVLRTGFVVPESIVIKLPYDSQSMTPGQAQKLAGDFALADLEAKYGQSRKAVGGFSGVQKATKEVNARTPSRPAKPGAKPPAPRARGGRRPDLIKARTVSRTADEVVIRITSFDPDDPFSAILRLVEKAFAVPRAESAQLSLEAPVNPLCKDPSKAKSPLAGQKSNVEARDQFDEDEMSEDLVDENSEKFWGSAAAVTSLEAFLELYPTLEDFEDSVCRVPEFADTIEVSVRLRPAKGGRR